MPATRPSAVADDAIRVRPHQGRWPASGATRFQAGQRRWRAAVQRPGAAVSFVKRSPPPPRLTTRARATDAHRHDDRLEACDDSSDVDARDHRPCRCIQTVHPPVVILEDRTTAALWRGLVSPVMIRSSRFLTRASEIANCTILVPSGCCTWGQSIMAALPQFQDPHAPATNPTFVSAAARRRLHAAASH